MRREVNSLENKEIVPLLFLHSGAELYGADIILLEILISLDKTQFKPVVILPNKGPLTEELDNIDITYEIIPYPILRRQYFNIRGIYNYFIQLIASLKKLIKIIKLYNIKIITSNTLAVLEGIFLSIITNTKHIWYIHEIIKEPKLMDFFYKVIISISRTNVVCVSNAVKENLSNKSKRLTVIHNGIRATDLLDLKVEKLKKDKVVIGMIGRINKIKGQSFLVDVINKLSKEYSNIEVVMVGGVFEGQEYLLSELENKINKYNLQDIIHIHKFTRDIKKYYQYFDIFVLPSVKPDSFPTVVLEAMASGLPIVANVTGGVSEMVSHGENGYLIDDCDMQVMCNYISKLIESPNLRYKFSKRSREIFEEKFTNEVFREKVNKYYMNLNY